MYSATTAKPIRGAVIELYSSPANTLLASTQSDGTGSYSFSVDSPGTAVFVRVRAQLLKAAAPGWDFRIADNTQGNAQYVLDTAPTAVAGATTTINATAASGWTGSSYGATRASAPFAILDAVYGALQKLQVADPTRPWPQLNLYWSPNNRPAGGDFASGLISSTLYAGPNAAGVHAVYVLGKADVDTDEFDTHVVTHEFGHYLQQVASRDDSLGGSHGSESLDPRVAFSEGWGDGWSAIGTSDPVYIDTSGAAQAQASIRDFSKPVGTGAGWYRSSSVAYLMWQFEQQVGFPAVWQALTSTSVRTRPPLTSLHLFAVALKAAAPAKATTVDSLLATQGTTAADAFGTTEANSGGIADTLPLYKNYAGVGTSQQLCANIAANTPDPLNKLGNWAFSFVRLPAKSYTIALTGGGDPDFSIYGADGFRRDARSSAAGVETLTVSLSAGDYVIAATEYSRTGRTCLALTIN